MSNKITPQIKETIQNLSNDGATNEEIQKFLLDKNVINLSVQDVAKIAGTKTVKKAETPKEPEQPKGEDNGEDSSKEPIDSVKDKIEFFVQSIESGQSEDQIHEFIESLEGELKPDAYRHYAVAKQQIAEKKHNELKAAHIEKVTNDASVKEKAIKPITDGIQKAMDDIDIAVKTLRDNNLSFSRALHVKKELARILKLLK